MHTTTLIFRFVTLCACFVASLSRASEPLRLKVMTFNIHHSEGLDGQTDVARIADVIRSAKPDLVALQEVDQRMTRTANIDQPAELARLTNMHVAFGGNLELQGGHYGNAILSRWPLDKTQNHLLPNSEGGEQRGVLVAEWNAPEAPQLRFMATHFDHRRSDTDRLASAKAVNQLLEHSELPALLAGDLNAQLGSQAMNQLTGKWTIPHIKDRPTFPAQSPTRQIDFILVYPKKRWRILDVAVVDEPVASDHRPLVASLELLP